jgi:DeoR/GlpR family transcriptional regulator of sugar metabolism
MFGSKSEKVMRLQHWVKLLRHHGEMTPGDMARALNVSMDAIADDLVTLHELGVLICQRGKKLSLLEHWSGENIENT